MSTIRPSAIKNLFNGKVYLLAIVMAIITTPRDTTALTMQEPGGKTSNEVYYDCIIQKVVPFCGWAALIYDPPAQEITSLTLTIDYDPLVYSFDEARSGPLGVFSVGGDARPPNPGVGTQLIQLLPSSGYEPGDPLPGSTLTYTDSPGLLSASYQFGNPVVITSNTNFFRLDFALLDPIAIDISNSAVTYETSALGGTDFSTVSFSCTTADGLNMCGSDTPSTGVSFDLALVPEPHTVLLMGVGLAGLGHARRRGESAGR